MKRDFISWLPAVVLGGVLRVWGLGFGLPNRLRPDEDMVVLPSLAMIGGDLDPHGYTYPTLYKYLLALIFRVCLALGIGPGSAESPWQFAAYGFFVDGSFFFLVARGVTALLGIATVYGVYLVGKEGYGRWVGIVGSLFLSVSVLHVRDSHFGVTDVGSVCFLVFGLYYVVRVLNEGGVNGYVGAGVLLGLASGTKYGSVLGVIPLGVAHLLKKPDEVSWQRWVLDRHILIAGGLVFGVFALTSPYNLLNVEAFSRDFGFQMRHLFEYGHGEDLGLGWWYHLRVSLRYGLGIFVLLFSIGGIVVCAVRRRPVDLVLLSLFVAYYVVCGQGKAVFFRYVLPLVPLCCVFGGVFVDFVRKQSFVEGRFLLVGVVLVGVGLVEPLWSSVRLDGLLVAEDTRVVARRWIEKHIPTGQKIANIGGVYGDVQINERHELGWWLPRYIRAFPNRPEIDVAQYLEQFPNAFEHYYLNTHYIGVEDLIAHSQGKPDQLQDPEVAYVVTHRHPLPYSQIHPEFWTLLNQIGTPIQEFRPGPLEDLEEGVFDRHDGFYYPIAGFGELGRGGPHIQVWRIENRDGFVMPDPGDPRGLLSDVLWWTGNGDLAKNDFAQAEAYYRRSLKLNPDSAELRVFLGATLLFQNRFEEALVEMREGIENGIEMGKIERAIFFKRSFRGDLYARLGDVFAALEFFTEATMIYERAISLGYNTGEIYSKLGLVYALIGKFDAAKVQFQNALKRMDGEQDLIQMRTILGVALLSQGRVHEAIEEIRQVLDYGVVPKDIEESVFLIKSSRGDLFAGLGTVFASLDRLSDAVRNYERALAMAYKNVDLHNNLGVVYYRLEALDEAAAQFREALAMDADNTDARYNLEQVTRRLGKGR